MAMKRKRWRWPDGSILDPLHGSDYASIAAWSGSLIILVGFLCHYLATR